MGRTFISDESGAVVSDWVVLSAVILLFGMVVTYAVMHDSAGYLMAEFDEMNQHYARESSAVAALNEDGGGSREYSSSQ